MCFVSFPSLRSRWQIPCPRTGTADPQETEKGGIGLFACELVQPFPAADCNKYCLCKAGWCAASFCSSLQPLSVVRDAENIKPVPMNPEEQDPCMWAPFFPPVPQCESEVTTLKFRSPTLYTMTVMERRARLFPIHTEFSISLKDPALK